MNSRVLYYIVLSLVLVISGCAGKTKDRRDYRQARLDKPLNVPASYSTSKIIDYYAIPPVQVGLVDELAEVPTPPALSLADEGNLVKIQALADKKWILVQLVPGQVWPLITQFAVQEGMGVVKETASQGAIETDWLLKTNDDSLREKYRFIVKQGVQRTSTEVTIMQYETAKDAPFLPLKWNTPIVDQASASGTLEKLARYMADFADPTAAVSLRAQNIDTQSRVYLAVEGEPTIHVRINTEKGFASSSYAITKSGFDVSDINRNTGQFYATPEILEQEKKSAYKQFFSKLAFYSKDEQDGRWAFAEYVFVLSQSDKPGWLTLTVDTAKGLSKLEKKELLKEVKRNLT